ncbi:ribosomal protein L44E [Bradyrhizobium elkanii]|uniref:hypothetical protein n=1 Tax=Bradyrhizobium elkanii TaxID=29448 RepID=UPI002168F4D9|nr:hypothetical protein [Bradyrhizobium elkanii]MCS3449950.1 ribosomal protein L44E [Bradyrhizobium elkanii]MCS3558905.1 ribosomal protein L44E [Bradyrhizobium elkanii]MCW2151247.1 ribosomal protein L44E [Bradyrhizobium elkanii]MCW2374978.1 ribosomal protein L44E [Bradyrhizobium elkanii]
MFSIIALLDRDYDDDDIETVIRTNRQDHRVQKTAREYRRVDRNQDGYGDQDQP